MKDQQDYLGRDKTDYDLTLVQFKIPIERKRDFQLWCRQKGFTGGMSQALNMIIVKVLENERTIHDPATLRPIETAIKEIGEIIPIMARHGLFKAWQK
jgi:hypothetical protein